MATEVDIAIVGGGAAGIGAARRLAARGLDILLLEARDRLGGRAWTREVEGLPLDLGCGWLHSAERNGWTGIAEKAAVTIDRTPPAWHRQFRDLGFTPEDQAAAGRAFDAFDRRLRESPPASDRASDALAPEGPWNAWLDALSGYINGSELAATSVADYLAYDDAASETNWRLPGGYGALVAGAVPADVPVRLGCPVDAIALDPVRVRLETAAGTLSARQVILTVPTDVLAAGTVRLPSAADDLLHAAAALPLGLADKLFLAVDGADALDRDAHLIGNPHDPNTGSYTLRPFGRPVIECFFGGRGARALERAGADGMAEFAIGELAGLLGSDWRRRLRPIAASRWGEDRWARGSYSHARPGTRGARATLAGGFDPRVLMAGEACSSTDFSTAHGALATGIAAAEAALVSLAPAGA